MQSHESIPTLLIEPSDKTLVQEFLAGDQRAFEVLITRYRPLLYRFVYCQLRDYDQVCDVVQQVFLQLYISLPALPRVELLKAWLLRVAQNRCLDELRRRRRRPVTNFSELGWQSEEEEEQSPLTTLPDLHPLPEELAEYRDLQRTLMQALREMSPRFRAVVLLRYAEQLSFYEIGQRLDMPETTAKTYYYRARARLRAALIS